MSSIIIERTWIAEAIANFGRSRGVPHLAEVVIDLYDASLKTSSKNTYKTGQSAYFRFVQELNGGILFPFEALTLSETELNLAFFMANLILRPTITVGATIASYVTHVKY